MFKILVGTLLLGFAFGQCPNPPVIDVNTLDHPYYSELNYYRSGDGMIVTCPAILITKKFALTSASCLIHSGSVDDFQIRFSTGAAYIKAFYIHEEYNHNFGDNNVGIIEFTKEITISEGREPIELADVELVEGSQVIALGSFQIDNNKIQAMELEVLEQETCKKQYNVKLGVGTLCGRVQCNEGDGDFVCNKAVGGPVIVDGKLVGISSGPQCTCGHPDKPTILTNIAFYKDFINNIVNPPPEL